MALHPKIEIKSDGVADVAMTDARAALTSLIREVSWGQRPGAFTERGKRVAMVVPPEFYEQALRDRAVIELLRKRSEEAASSEHPELQKSARTVHDWLADAEATPRS
ncbi:type II toxin-antitoxin system Phd/YefM family antitoxin [Streptomyces sp. FBKL.4005]|uniref:type II toxin-antitoxin system Phd/YefM family antitoxin n=1 Tax=Streptomyces sp. FBKL.4005 TaxID=2015515 RepID=UPI001679895C|nr:type II toxin-antitoxin system Phd/YefM family antitoxin [Streptomyces sp. FBKL.4005]